MHAPQKRRGALVPTIIAASLFVVSHVSVANGQTSLFGAEFSAGLNFSRLSLSTTPDGISNQFQPGFNVGVAVDYGIVPFLSLELGARYTELGGELEGAIEFLGDTFEGQGKIKLTYLTFPLLVEAKAPGFTARPYVKAGPHLGITLKADAEAKPLEGVSVENDIKDDIETLDFGVSFAAGVEFPLTTLSGFVEVGYAWGFTDVFKVDQNVGELVNAKNQVFAITLGLSR